MDYNSAEFYKHILENIVGVIAVDSMARIVFINKKYADFLEVRVEDVIGKNVKDVVPTTRLDTVLKTATPEYADTPVVMGKKILCNRVPLIVNGATIGAAAMIFTEKIANDFAFVDSINEKLQSELDFYKKEIKLLQGARYSIDNIIGRSADIKSLKKKIMQAASTSSTVLIQGETGTGKELVAHSIHQESKRKHRPLVRLNCAAIPFELLESELFGYTEGAFTGASKKGKLGKMEIASKGSILLDEINEMPLRLQVKLLRVVQEKEIDKIGSNKPIPIDVRIIAATSQPLENLVEKNEFREDLYYRLSVVVIQIPPLRNRVEDIPLLVEHFIEKLNKSLGLNVTGADKEVIDLLCQYNWPGNVRELENAVERAMNLCLKGRLDLSHFKWLALKLGYLDSDDSGGYCLKEELAESELKVINNALSLCKGNKTKAAKLLGINRATLYKKLKKLSL